MTRSILILLLCAAPLFAAAEHATRVATGARPTPAPESVYSIAALHAKLASETPTRDLDQASPEELQLLLPSEGGLLANVFNGEYVMKVGLSTFIIDMRLISVVLLSSLLVIVLFFTPFGLWVFRGGAHRLFGAVLSASGVAPEFGRHLAREPKRYVAREGSVRKGFAMYMHNAFIPNYKNNVTAIAFLGTAFLILNIGMRGIKFMVAHQPDLIIVAILVEITVLCLLGLTTWYEKTVPDEAPAMPAVARGDLSLDEVKAKIAILMAELEASHGEAVHAEAKRAG